MTKQEGIKMACFVVPAVEAIAVGIAAKVKTASENRKAISEVSNIDQVALDSELTEVKANYGWTWGQKLSLLTKLLVGGAVLLCLEHICHGEVVPYAPFLTALQSPDSTAEMISEMSTVGVAMSGVVTVAWAGICGVADHIAKKANEKSKDEITA